MALLPATAQAGWFRDTPTTGNGADLASTGTTLYRAYTTNTTAVLGDVYVESTTGGAWSAVGGTLNTSYGAGGQVSIALMGTAPYVAYTEEQTGGSGTCHLRVKYWTGASWTLLGGASIATDTGPCSSAHSPHIAIDGANVVVAWNPASVNAYRWAGASWTQLGAALPTNDSCCRGPHSVTHFGGEPIVTYGSSGGSRVWASQWTGAAWSQYLYSTGAAFDLHGLTIGSTYYGVESNWDCWSVNPDSWIVVSEWDGVAWDHDTELLVGTKDCDNHTLGTTGSELAIAYSTPSWGGVSVWTSSGGLLQGSIGRLMTPLSVAYLGTTPYVAVESHFSTSVWKYVSGSGQQPLVPNEDRAGTSQISYRLTNCTGTSTSDMFSRVDETVDHAATESECSFSQADELLVTDTNSAANFVSFELTEPDGCIASASAARVRAHAWTTGGKSTTLTVSLRTAGGALVGTPTTWAVTNTPTFFEYSLTGLSLTKADVDGLYIEAEMPISGGGSSTVGLLNAIEVELTYAEAAGSCYFPYAPKLGPPYNGAQTGAANPTLQALHEDVDGDTGQLEFELCTVHTEQTESCIDAGGVVLQSGTSAAGIASGTKGSWTVPSSLPPGTYRWHARSIDSTGATSPWSETFSFVVIAPVEVSGTALETEAGAVWSECDGVTANITLVDAGSVAQSTSCSAVDGSFTFTHGISANQALLVLYMNDDAVGNDGAQYVIASTPSTSITGLRVVDSVVAMRSVGGNTFYTSTFDAWNVTDDADVPVSMSGSDLTVASSMLQVRIDAATTFSATANTTVPRYHVIGTFEGTNDLHTLTAGGTDSCTSLNPRPFCIAGGTYFYLTGGTIRYAATAESTIESTGYYWLQLRPAGAGSPTYHLGSVASGAMSAHGITIGDGTNPVTASTTTASPELTANSYITVSANAQLVGTGSGTITVANSFSGSGTVSLGGGLVDLRATAATTTTLGPTTGTNDWTFQNLQVSNASAGARTARTAGSATGAIRVSGDLTVGAAADTQASIFDVNLTDRVLDVDGNVLVRSVGTLQASSTQTMTVAGDMTIQGTWNANGGTIQFDGTSTSTTLSHTASLTFANLIVTTPDKLVQLDAVQQLAVTGTATIGGGTCSTPVQLESSTAGDRADLDLTGTATITYARLKDLNAVSAISATNTVDAGNNANITIDAGTCTGATLSMSVDAPAVPLGVVAPGNNVTATTTVDVSTDSTTGYTLAVTDEDDAWSMNDGGLNSVTDWTGTGATPTTWPGATDGYFGVTVVSATGGRMAKWGSGGGPYPMTDDVNNLFAGLDQSVAAVAHSTSGVAASDEIVVGYRVNVAASQPPGAYDGQVTYTAVMNP